MRKNSKKIYTVNYINLYISKFDNSIELYDETPTID